MKMATAVTLATLLLVPLAGCGSDIETGYITKKIYEREWVETRYDRACSAYDPKGACKAWANIPRVITHSPEWRFDLKEGNVTGYVYVDQETYGRYQVGDHYPIAR